MSSKKSNQFCQAAPTPKVTIASVHLNW